MKVLLLFLQIVLLCCCCTVVRATTLSGTETYLGIYDSPYYASETLYFEQEVYIDEGVEVFCAPSSSLTFSNSVTMNGSESNPIVFTSQEEGKYWGGIDLMGQHSEMSHVSILNTDSDALQLSDGVFNAKFVTIATNATVTGITLEAYGNVGSISMENVYVKTSGDCIDYKQLNQETGSVEPLGILESVFECGRNVMFALGSTEQVILFANNTVVAESVLISSPHAFSIEDNNINANIRVEAIWHDTRDLDPSIISKNIIQGTLSITSQLRVFEVRFNTFNGGSVAVESDSAIYIDCDATQLLFEGNTVANFTAANIMVVKESCDSVMRNINVEKTEIIDSIASHSIFELKGTCKPITFKENFVSNSSAYLVYNITGTALSFSYNSIDSAESFEFLAECKVAEQIIELGYSYWGSNKFSLIQPKMKDILNEKSPAYGAIRYYPICDKMLVDCTMRDRDYIFDTSMSITESEQDFPYSIYIQTGTLSIYSLTKLRFGPGQSIIVGKEASLVFALSSGDKRIELLPMDYNQGWGGILFFHGINSNSLLRRVTIQGAGNGAMDSALFITQGSLNIDYCSIDSSTNGILRDVMNTEYIPQVEIRNTNINAYGGSGVDLFKVLEISHCVIYAATNGISLEVNGNIKYNDIIAPGIGLQIEKLQGSYTILDNVFQNCAVAIKINSFDTAGVTDISANTMNSCVNALHIQSTEESCNDAEKAQNIRFTDNTVTNKRPSAQAKVYVLVPHSSVVKTKTTMQCTYLFLNNKFYGLENSAVVFGINAYGNHAGLHFNTMENNVQSYVKYEYTTSIVVPLNFTLNYFGTLNIDQITPKIIDVSADSRVLFNPALAYSTSDTAYDLNATCLYDPEGDCNRDFNCFGVNADDEYVCNGGYCYLPNLCGKCPLYTGPNCTCPEPKDKYSGYDCVPVSCYGKAFTDAGVCSGHGECIEENKCECESGYSDSTCSLFSCYNITSTDPEVCNGRGNCKSVDTCECFTGFDGDDCVLVKPKIESIQPLVSSINEPGYNFGLHPLDGSLFYTGFDKGFYKLYKRTNEGERVELFASETQYPYIAYEIGKKIYLANDTTILSVDITTMAVAIYAGGIESYRYPFSNIVALGFVNTKPVAAEIDGNNITIVAFNIDDTFSVREIEEPDALSYKVVHSLADGFTYTVQVSGGKQVKVSSVPPRELFTAADSFSVDGELSDPNTMIYRFNSYDIEQPYKVALDNTTHLKFLDLGLNQIVTPDGLQLGSEETIHVVKFASNGNGVYALTRTGTEETYSIKRFQLTYPSCSNECFGHGDCAFGACRCYSGYSGPLCKSFNCDAVSDCSGHGECNGPNMCSCEKEFKGEDCSEPRDAPIESTLLPSDSLDKEYSSGTDNFVSSSIAESQLVSNTLQFESSGPQYLSTPTLESGLANSDSLQATTSQEESSEAQLQSTQSLETVSSSDSPSAFSSSFAEGSIVESQLEIELINVQPNYTLCSNIEIDATVTLDGVRTDVALNYIVSLDGVQNLQGEATNGTIRFAAYSLQTNKLYKLVARAVHQSEYVEQYAYFSIIDNSVAIIDQSSVATRRSSSTTFTSSLSVVPNCISVAYQWRVVRPNGVEVRTSNSSSLLIPRYTLATGTYTVELSISSSQHAYQISTSVTLTITSTTPSVSIAGGDVVINARNYTLVASANDADNLVLDGTYAWICRVTEGNTACPSTPNTSTFVLSPVNGSDGTFEVSVVYTTLNKRTANDTVYITFTSQRVPRITIATSIPKRIPNNQKLTVEARAEPLTDIPNINIRWSLRVSGQTTDILSSNRLLSGLNGRSLVFVPTALVPGVEYRLRVDASYRNSTTQAFSRVILLVAGPPTDGTFTVSPELGTELTTQFTMRADGWNTDMDALPLNYAFDYLEDGVFIPLQSLSLASAFATTLSKGATNSVTLRCRVRNFYGAEVAIQKSVVVNQLVIANATSFIGNLLTSIPSGAAGRNQLLNAAKVFSSQGVKDRDLTNRLVSFIGSVSEEDSGSEDVLLQKMKTLSFVTQGNSFVNPETISFLPNLLVSVTASGDSPLPDLIGGVISDTLLTDDGNGTDTASELIASLSSFSLRSLSPGESGRNITTDAFSATLSKNYASSFQNTSLSSSNSGIFIPSSDSLDSEDTVLSVEYINFENTEIGLWSGRSANLSSSITSFRFLDENGNKIKFSTSSSDPIVITLARAGGDLEANTTLSCQYLDDYGVDTIWKTDGCVLHDILEDRIVCHCNHTTSFAAFVQFSQEEVEIPLTSIQRGVYYTGIVFYSIFFVVSLALFAFLFTQRKTQPVRSRSFAPYFCLIAIMVESALLVARNGIWVSKNPNADALNVLGDVIMFVANPLAIVSLFMYLWQMIRYFLMKHAYHIMGLGRGEVDTRKVKILRFFSSTLVFAIVSAVVYVLIFVYFFIYSVVMLSTRAKITTQIAQINTTALVISYSSMVLVLAVAIAIVFVWDTFIVPLQIKHYEMKLAMNNIGDQVNRVDNELQKKEQSPATAILKPLKYHFFKDDPLYFRLNTLFMIASVLACFITFSIGIANRYQKRSDSSGVMVASLVFDLIYTTCRIIAYGGFIAFIRVVTMVLNRNSTFKEIGSSCIDVSDESDNTKDKIEAVIGSPVGFKLIKEFCIKEFSLENLLIYNELRSINREWLNMPVETKTDVYNAFIEKYIKTNAEFEVNIPGNVKKLLLSLKDTLDKTTIDEQMNVFKKLVNSILTNLSDTFSRFYETQEFKNFTLATTLNNALESTLNENAVPRMKWFSTDVEMK